MLLAVHWYSWKVLSSSADVTPVSSSPAVLNGVQATASNVLASSSEPIVL